MTANIVIQRAHAEDVPAVAVLVGELLTKIMNRIGDQAFNFNLQETTERLASYLANETYFVFVARPDGGKPIGFVALSEPVYRRRLRHDSGTVRSAGLPHPETGDATRLQGQGVWRGAGGGKRLEVTTPPLPQFDRTLAFYERDGFSVVGGRKLKALLL